MLFLPKKVLNIFIFSYEWQFEYSQKITLIKIVAEFGVTHKVNGKNFIRKMAFSTFKKRIDIEIWEM